MTPHINAAKGDIAEIVLMPGDPYRAKWAAENFLTKSKLVNQVRGMLGFTGIYNDSYEKIIFFFYWPGMLANPLPIL